MKKLFVSSAIIVLAVAGFCLAQDSAKADKYALPPLPQELKHADSLLAAGDSTKGLAELRAVVNSKAEDEVRASAQYSIGKFYEKEMKKVDIDTKIIYKQKVKEELKKVAESYPNSIYKPWAQLYAASHSFDKKDSKIMLNEVINNYPISAEVRQRALRLQATKLYIDRDHKDAITAYRQYVKDYPEDRYRCADALYHIGLMTKDNSIYEEVINIYPDQQNIALLSYDGIAENYWIKGEKSKAMDIRMEAINKYKAHSSIPTRLFNIQSLFEEIGEWEKANEIKQRILNEYSDSKQAKEIRSWSQPQK